MSQPEFQHYWRCEHYPSAIENFFGGRTECQYNCHLMPLTSTDSGFHPIPRGSLQWAELQRNGL
jgi:hypothetical protein